MRSTLLSPRSVREVHNAIRELEPGLENQLITLINQKIDDQLLRREIFVMLAPGNLSFVAASLIESVLAKYRDAGWFAENIENIHLRLVR